MKLVKLTMGRKKVKKNFKRKLATLLMVALLGSSMGSVTFAGGIGASPDSDGKFAASGSEVDFNGNGDITESEKADDDKKQEADEKEVIQDKEPEKEEQNSGDKEKESEEKEVLGEDIGEATDQEAPEILDPENQIMFLEAELEEEGATPSEADFMSPNKPVWMIGKHAPGGKDRPGWGMWTDNLTEEEKDQVYTTYVSMYRDGEELEGGNEDEYTTRDDFRFFFEEPGEYQFKCIYLMSENEDMDDADWSEMSDPYTYDLIGKKAPTPTGLKWSRDGKALWDNVLQGVNDYENYKDEYEGGSSYKIKVYQKEEDGTYDYDSPLGFWITGKQEANLLYRYKDPSATYVFTVSTIGDLIHYDFSDESLPSPEFYAGDASEEARTALEALLNMSDVKAAVENTALSPDERDVLKMAVQTDQSAEEKLKEVEEKYRTAAGKSSVEIKSGSALVDASQVSVTGGILNGAEAINFQPAEIEDEDLHYKKVVGMDISLEGAPSEDLNFPILITMPVPKGIHANKLVIVHYRSSGDKEYIYPRINGGTISFAVTGFSEFAFVDTSDDSSSNTGGNDNPNNNGSSGGHSSSGRGGSSGGGSSKTATSAGTSGSWSQDENGWHFTRLIGTQPVLEWLMTTDGNWYRFDEKGYMMTGWFTDVDGNRYYLNPVSDGTKGAMKIGWQAIDGKMYYFNPVSDGTKGAMRTGWQMIDGSWYYFSAAQDETFGMMLTSAVTPDGYRVGGDGKYVE